MHYGVANRIIVAKTNVDINKLISIGSKNIMLNGIAMQCQDGVMVASTQYPL